MGLKIKNGKLTCKFKVKDIKGQPVNLVNSTNKTVKKLNKGIRKKL